MKTKHIIAIILVVIGLGIGIWYFSSNARKVEKTPDPYEELRKTTGPWTSADTMDYSRSVVIQQDIPEATGDVDNWYKTFLAFNKGYNLSVNAWTLRDILLDDFIAFVHQYGHMRHVEVSQGQFIA